MAQLLAQRADMHLDPVAVDFGIEGIKPFLKLRLCQQVLRALQEGLAQHPFLDRERHRPALGAQAAGGKIDLQRPKGTASSPLGSISLPGFCFTYPYTLAPSTSPSGSAWRYLPVVGS
jgi:hypothetical protein